MTDAPGFAAKVAWPRSAAPTEAPTPLSFGIDLPAGRLRDEGTPRIELPGGQRLTAQATPLSHWPDGSLRWLLIDSVVPPETPLAGQWHVRFTAADNALDHSGLDIRQSADVIEIGNPLARTSASSPLDAGANHGGWALSFDIRTGLWSAKIGEQVVARAALPIVTDASGRQHTPTVKQVRLAAVGPVRATVEVQAEYRRLRGLRLVARWSVFAGTDLLDGQIMLHNPRRARHRGGLWDLGDPGSILLADFTQSVSLAGTSAATGYRCEPGQPIQYVTGPVEIYQESSGGEHWDSKNHVNRHGQVPMRMKGYSGRAGDATLAGLRAQPIAILATGALALAAEIEDFWQQFPKAIEADCGEIRLRLFPRQFPDLHELQGGEQKTHRIRVMLEAAAQKVQKPPHFPRRCQPLSLSPRAIPGLPDWTTGDPMILAQLDELAEEFLTGPRGLYANRERVDEYGWRNWGDLYADHEEQHYEGSEPLISHYNNQFDVLLGFQLQYLRTGDQRWMELAHALSRHVIDIDIYHTTDDRPAYSGGLFWMTDHYKHAQTAGHRTYSRHNVPARGGYGGGPSACHNFTTGLLLYHLLTGDAQAREAVLTLADWVLAQDDGSRTVLGLVDDGPTGMASASSGVLDHRPGRAAGNSINALLDAWLLTADRRYLDQAETLLRRCVHPRQDIGALDLLHAEWYWSYTMFLVSHDKLLHCKHQGGRRDDAHAYGQASLLHYGRWMCRHERPYLEQPASLENVSETWAAQDLRKANALRLASQYAHPDEAGEMQLKGRSLAERAWSDLTRFVTRSSTRAMAIVLVEGVRDAQLNRQVERLPLSEPCSPCPAAGRDYPPLHVFESQRERVKRRMRSTAGVVQLFVCAANPARWPRIINHR